MEDTKCKLRPIDELYLRRAYELAARAVGGATPNPPVGAVVVSEGRIVGEGYHRRAGDAHAEPIALARAGGKARGSTLYVSLEPCRHVGRTPPCTAAIVEAGVARVVVGTLDPTSHGGAGELREHGVDVCTADDAVARGLVEMFAQIMARKRPYVALKMAMSLDGRVARRRGVHERLGSPEEEEYVRALRTAYDAVMVGAGTIRIDNPQLTVRPPHDRPRAYVRIVVCEHEPVAADSRVFADRDGYGRTIVLIPAGVRSRFDALRSVADIVEVGSSDDVTLDLEVALRALRERSIFSVLCEGGPRLAASLLADRLVDRIYWAITPRLFAGDAAVPVLSGRELADARLRFDRIERLGADIMVSGVPELIAG